MGLPDAPGAPAAPPGAAGATPGAGAVPGTTLPRPRPDVAALPGYVPGARAPGPVHKLSSNENPAPPPAAVVEAARRAAAELHRYPDPAAADLTAVLAARHGVGRDQVVLGTGSVAVLGHVIQAYCGPGDEVVMAWRSFEAYPICAGIAGARPVRVPLTSDARHDLPAMAAAVTDRTRVLLVCTPNNPTGPVVTQPQVEALLAAVPGDVVVVLDEAYVDYVRGASVDGDAVRAAHPNVVLLRTFSKAAGLAGLRVGYGVGHPRVMAPVRAVATPFGVNTVAQAAALAALEPAVAAELRARIDATVAERERVVAALREQGWAVPEAQGNFVWLPAGDRSTDLAADAAAHAVLVRAFAGEGIRVTIGTPEANDAVLALARRWASG